MLLEVDGYTTLLLPSRNNNYNNYYVCVHLFGCQNKSNVFSEVQVFKCFLCACAENDAGRKTTSGPPLELDAKRLEINVKDT